MTSTIQHKASTHVAVITLLSQTIYLLQWATAWSYPVTDYFQIKIQLREICSSCSFSTPSMMEQCSRSICGEKLTLWPYLWLPAQSWFQPALSRESLWRKPWHLFPFHQHTDPNMGRCRHTFLSHIMYIYMCTDSFLPLLMSFPTESIASISLFWAGLRVFG